MKYLCLAHGDTTRWHTLVPAEQAAVALLYAELRERLRASGSLVAMDDFWPIRTAATVRVRSRSHLTGTVVPVDGWIGGFYLIRAYDLNDAVRIVARTPVAYLAERLGWEIEVRHVADR